MLIFHKTEVAEKMARNDHKSPFNSQFHFESEYSLDAQPEIQILKGITCSREDVHSSAILHESQH